MPYLSDTVFDNGLSALAGATHLHLCSGQPANFAGVAGVSLGAAPVTVGAPAARSGGGRKVTVPAITGGSVTATGTASHYALVTGSALLAAAPLAAAQVVTADNEFSLSAFDVGMPGPVV